MKRTDWCTHKRFRFRLYHNPWQPLQTKTSSVSHSVQMTEVRQIRHGTITEDESSSTVQFEHEAVHFFFGRRIFLAAPVDGSALRLPADADGAASADTELWYDCSTLRTNWAGYRMLLARTMLVTGDFGAE